ncbi:MAG: hypothetical protein MUE31_07475 [Candidatus Nanopelagicales bacterium]|nr:hypothetical protein [Candidatus Nanopelagicales bacterium]MCU0295591.1 hypothetical protein [Candidatus Nanopelagicales bacterium]
MPSTLWRSEAAVGLFDWLGWFNRSTVEPEARMGEEPTAVDKDEFIGARTRFRGEFTPENLAFDSNLQEFATRVAYICGLETAGKIAPDEAHRQIRELYEELSRTHKGLGIGEDE